MGRATVLCVATVSCCVLLVIAGPPPRSRPRPTVTILTTRSPTTARSRRISVLTSQGESLMLDPRKTWRNFLQHTEKNAAAHRRKNLRRYMKSATLHTPGSQGPAGPPGPRGPRGPPGADVTKAELVKEFRDMVREAAERRAQLAVDPKCEEECAPTLEVNATGRVLPPLFEVDHTAIVPKMLIAFFWELTDDVVVPRKSFVELRHYHLPFAPGGYERGIASERETGRFAAPRDGFYTFHVSAQLQAKDGSVNKGGNRDRDSVSVMVCINSLCEKNVSIETVAVVSAPRRRFTVAVTGLLQLQEGNYVSVYVNNSSRRGLKVLKGTQMTGYLTAI